MSIWYNGGTLAVESGSASVVGTSTLFATQVKEGDALFIDGTLYQVTEVADDTHLTVEPVYAGSTDSGVAYYILPTSPDWGQVSSVAADLAAFLATRATFFPTDGKPEDALGGNGSFAVDPNATPPLLYVKTNGTWDDGTSLGGPMGATGKSYGGTSTDSKTLAATGSMTFATQSGLAWLAGNRIRIASAAAPTTKWMEGVISSYSGSTLIVTIDKQGSGSGSASDWNFGPAGIPGEKGDIGATGSTGSTGATGAAGAGYGGTSTTSRTIGSSGTMTWNIGTGYAYQNGDLVKIVSTSDSTKWMKGKVSGYSAGVLSVDVSEDNGSGTLASWNIGLAGETGPQGIQGTAGTAGSNGTSPNYNATSSTSLTPATGSKAFTVASGLSFVAGQRVRAASSANLATNWMSGIVESYSSTMLTVAVDLIGSAPASAPDWVISISGEKGDQGPAGGFGALDATKGNFPVADGSSYGASSFGSDGNILQADSTQTYGVASRAVGEILANGARAQTTIASAATVDIGAANTDYVVISGTTTITSFGTRANNVRRVRFSGILTLTYNGTSLILPGLANITTAAGDEAEFASDASGKWKCTKYQRASGLLLPSAATQRSAIGLDTGNSPQFTEINLGHATDTTLARIAAGRASIEGNEIGLMTSGSWTPDITFGGGKTGITYVGRNGSWKRVGNIVLMQGYFEFTSKGSSTGKFLIGGTPFTVPGDNGVGGFVWNSGMSGLTSPPMLSGNGSVIQARQQAASTTSDLTDASFTNSTQWFFTFVHAV